MMPRHFSTLAILVQAVSAQEYTTPVNKVLELLNDMHVKAVATMNEEEKVMASFAQKCADDERVMENMIVQEQEEIDQYAADIAKASADISRLANELADLATETNFAEKDQKAATKVRQQEKTDFLATDVDYEETLLALDKATALLASKSVTTEAADSLLQLGLSSKSETTKTTTLSSVKVALTSFLKSDQAPPEAKAYAYETQMSGVIDMLKNLKEQFYGERTALNKEELTAKHQYDVMMEVRSGEIDGYKAATARKTKLRGRRQSAKGAAEGYKAETEKTKAADEKEMSENKANCALNIETYNRQQALRENEVSSLAEAISILGSETVKGSAEKYMPKATSFLQVSRSSVFSATKGRSRANLAGLSDSDKIAKASEMLLAKATTLQAGELSMLATKIAANPLKKVTEMIRNLISKLTNESTGEADQKAWCGVKLVENKVEREAKENEVEDLTAVNEKLEAAIARLNEDIANLQEEVAFLSQDRDSVQKERAASKKQNEQTIHDAEQGAAAVAKAISMLQKYYAQAKSDAAELDQAALDSKNRANAAVVYGGQQDKASGVIAVLEVIQSDFARLESETSSAEAQAAELYEKFMNSSEVDLEVKKTTLAHKTEVKSKRTDDKESNSDELTNTNSELQAANKVYMELKPVCIDTGMTYEERVQRREAEIESLKEVLEVLAQNESGAI